MVNAYSPTSFTKNLGWQDDYSTLHASIRSGFAGKPIPTLANTWRERSGLPDSDRELVPLRFFLCSQIGPDGSDYVSPDELVLRAVHAGYDAAFGSLGLFAFHLARSGKWRRSKWPGGRLMGWARDYICTTAWKDGAWQREAFEDAALENYIQATLSGQKKTKHKVFTNYRHMLRIAGVIVPGASVGPVPFSAGDWAGRACKLMWDRATYYGDIDEESGEAELIDFFMGNDGFKLLGTNDGQGNVIATYAAAEYVADGGINRFAAFV